jgi:hypothetical protein
LHHQLKTEKKLLAFQRRRTIKHNSPEEAMRVRDASELRQHSFIRRILCFLIGEILHSNKRYLALHLGNLGLAITATGLALLFKKKREEER